MVVGAINGAPSGWDSELGVIVGSTEPRNERYDGRVRSVALPGPCWLGYLIYGGIASHLTVFTVVPTSFFLTWARVLVTNFQRRFL